MKKRRLKHAKFRSLWYFMVPYGAVWYHMVPYGTIWYHMEPYGTIMVPFGTIWYHTDQNFPFFHFSISHFSKKSKFPNFSIFQFLIFIYLFHFSKFCLIFYPKKLKKAAGAPPVAFFNLVSPVTMDNHGYTWLTMFNQETLCAWASRKPPC